MRIKLEHHYDGIPQSIYSRETMACSGQICVPVINLYAQPNEESEVVSQALYGWKVDIRERCQRFQRIQTPDGYQGWVESRGVHSLSLPQISPVKKVKVIYNAVPVYSVPHVKNRPLWIFPFEVELAVLAEPSEEEGRWIQVQLVEGLTGWIQRGHIQLNPPALSLTQMLRISRQFLGIPYLWGGTSSFGYDCSGFVQMLWRQRGIFLPRDAKQQCHEVDSHPVAWNCLEPGDLLFYGSSETDIRHVGLYLGEQRLIHASVKPIPIVQESFLDDLSLRQRFAYRTARRLPLKQESSTPLADL